MERYTLVNASVRFFFFVSNGKGKFLRYVGIRGYRVGERREIEISVFFFF